MSRQKEIEWQRYSRWFTTWPSTHKRAGQTVEVMPVAELKRIVDAFPPVEVTDEMVERAANAITDRLDGDSHYCFEWGGSRCTICRDIARIALRAALEAGL